MTRYSALALFAMAAAPGAGLAQSSGALEQVVLQLRWEYEFQFAGFIAAKEMGFYRDAGLDVEVRELHFGMSVYDELTSGRAQYGVGTTDALVQRADGVPVVALAAIFQHSPMVVISREDAGIRSPEDLVGRRVSMYSTLNPILDAMLQSEGVDARQVEFEPYDPDYAGFISGETPATTAVLSLQPYVFEQLGIPFSIIRPVTYGIDFYGNTLITLDEEIRTHPERVRAFREASLKGWTYALANPEDIIDIMMEKYSPQVDRGLLEFEAEVTQGLIQPDIIAIGHMNPDRWRNIEEHYRALGMTDDTVSLAEFLYDPTPVHDNSALLRLIGMLAGLTLLVGGVAASLYTLNSRLRRSETEREHKIKALQDALSEIKMLQELLPICASCKKIRNEEGSWENIEIYISKNTDTQFSHGICPDCSRDLYGAFMSGET